LPSMHSTLPRRSATRRVLLTLAGWFVLIYAALSAFAPATAFAAPSIILPTAPGQDWKIIQGYGCGTHNAWDRYSVDLAQVGGPTYDAPIRAALGGEIWAWEGSSGTIILSHGGGFYTMYTHMARAVDTYRGRYYEAGETLGFAGDRGSPGTPHLHFTAFTAGRDGWSNKQSVPLRFAEGYDFPDVGGCNQHGGSVVRAASIQDPELHFRSEAQPGRWFNSDQRVEFSADWAGGGLSQSWDKEPGADAPMFPRHTDGYAQLSDAGEGMHTLMVRVWGPDGRQALASYGPIGLDTSSPAAPAPIADINSAPGITVVPWQPAADALSGVAGYRVYIGADPAGTSEWFTAEPVVKTPELTAGSYLVRVQTLDNAGNTSSWATIGKVVVAP
jgi:murein DD-endopeptidase MepM/ murein hydrolase activator NlpD